MRRALDRARRRRLLDLERRASGMGGRLGGRDGPRVAPQPCLRRGENVGNPKRPERDLPEHWHDLIEEAPPKDGEEIENEWRQAQNRRVAKRCWRPSPASSGQACAHRRRMSGRWMTFPSTSTLQPLAICRSLGSAR